MLSRGPYVITGVTIEFTVMVEGREAILIKPVLLSHGDDAGGVRYRLKPLVIVVVVLVVTVVVVVVEVVDESS